MKGKFNISESEKNRILNLHENLNIKKLLVENTNLLTKLNDNGRYEDSGSNFDFLHHDKSKSIGFEEIYCWGKQNDNMIVCGRGGDNLTETVSISCDGVQNYGIDNNKKSGWFVRSNSNDEGLKFVKTLRNLFCCNKKVKDENLRKNSTGPNNCPKSQNPVGSNTDGSQNVDLKQIQGEILKILGPDSLGPKKDDGKLGQYTIDAIYSAITKNLG
jgi:hypothetical protein